jgi:hypothetical protein
MKGRMRAAKQEKSSEKSSEKAVKQKAKKQWVHTDFTSCKEA